MKALSQIPVIALLILSSCTSRLYTGGEYDDLYYLPSDRPIGIVSRQPLNEQITENTLKAGDYYDNIYTGDTLVSAKNPDASDYNDQVIINNNNYGGGYNYYDNFSYAGRLRNFYGNYFDPYWRDPFYNSWGYPSFGFSFGYGGFPYSYNFYDPFYWDPFSYGYGGYYGGYYDGFGYYSPFNRYYGYYPGSYFYNDGGHSTGYGRRERPSSLSSRWNNSMAASGYSRRDPYLSKGSGSSAGRRSLTGTQGAISDTRRSVPSNVNPQDPVSVAGKRQSQDPVKSENIGSNPSIQRRSPASRPEYNDANRSYTPSYSNPRMSTRPSYNNSRVPERSNSGINDNRSNNNSGSVRTPSNQNSNRNPANNQRSDSPGIQRRSAPAYQYSVPSGSNRTNSSRSSGSYYTPSRRSDGGSSGYSSGSFSNSSSGSRSSSSFGDGSSSSGSRGSYSSGSSSGSSSRSSSGRR